MYRLHVHDRRSTGLHWQIGKGGGFHYASAEARGADLPVTVFLGGPPALILAAIAPLPENVPELMLASLIAGARLPLVDGRGPHPLVADAEFALMGRVRPHVRKPEGPFGDHYGYYSLQHDYPVFEIERLARRRDAIYPATVVGKPRQEDFFIGDLLQTLLSPLFPLVMPAVRQLWTLRRDRLSLAGGGGGARALPARGDVERVPHPRRRAAVADQVPAGDRSRRRPARLPRHADARPGADAARDGPLRVLEPVDGHARLHRTAVNEGSKGVWLGLGDPVRTLPAAFSSADVPAGVRDVRVFCPGCLVVAGPALRVGARRRRADRDVCRPSPAGRWSS